MSLRFRSLSAILALVCSAGAAAASGQKTPDGLYAGTWDVTVREAGAGNKPVRKARVVFGRQDGSWEESGRASNRCAGRKFPVTVQRGDKLQLEFTVRRKDVVAECPVLGIKVAPVDEKTLVGGVVGPSDGHGHGPGDDHDHGNEAKDGAHGPVLEVRMTRVAGAGPKR